MLRDLKSREDARLIVGIATSDDAGVISITPDLALVQTVDFFTPVVDDPYMFGQIAAANSLSDVYAMGGVPLSVLNILCWPINDRDPDELVAILRGGSDKVREAGAALMGGHSVEDAEPKFGLAVTGTINPKHITTNAGAQVGDNIVLTKALGTGIITTASKYDDCSKETLLAACNSMATLNSGAAVAMRELGIGAQLPVHAATDITGFGLAGHLYHMAKASGVGIALDSSQLPLLPDVEELVSRNNITRADKENRDYIGEDLIFGENVSKALQSIILDPQTSGGLAICVSDDKTDELIVLLEQNGVEVRSIIGTVVASSEPKLWVN